jgi:hypothetical protein
VGELERVLEATRLTVRPKVMLIVLVNRTPKESLEWTQ